MRGWRAKKKKPRPLGKSGRSWKELYAGSVPGKTLGRVYSGLFIQAAERAEQMVTGLFYVECVVAVRGGTGHGIHKIPGVLPKLPDSPVHDFQLHQRKALVGVLLYFV